MNASVKTSKAHLAPSFSEHLVNKKREPYHFSPLQGRSLTILKIKNFKLV